jgi:hypothetical protein
VKCKNDLEDNHYNLFYVVNWLQLLRSSKGTCFFSSLSLFLSLSFSFSFIGGCLIDCCETVADCIKYWTSLFFNTQTLFLLQLDSLTIMVRDLVIGGNREHTESFQLIPERTT